MQYALFLFFFLFTHLFGNENRSDLPENHPRHLKMRQPNWRARVIEKFPNGEVKSLIFYAPSREGIEDVPVRYIHYYPSGIMKSEIDLIVLEKEDARINDFHTSLLASGGALFYTPDGQIEKMGSFAYGKLDGPFRHLHPNGKPYLEIHYNQGKLDGPLKTSDEKGRLIREGFYKNGKKEGLFNTYHSNGKLKASIPYHENLVDGCVKEWDEEGNLKVALNYFRGVLDNDNQSTALILYYKERKPQETQDFIRGIAWGTHKKYHPNGAISYKAQYVLGQKEGVEEYFDPDGNSLGGGKYLHGQPVGEHKLYHTNQTLATLAKYDEKGKLLEPICEWDTSHNKIREFFKINNLIDGPYTTFYLSGQIKNKHHYRHGLFDGEQIDYYLDGKIEEISHYKEGVPHGRIEEWYPDGKVALKGNYVDGSLEGLQVEWYANGEKKSEENYLNGSLNGERVTFFENGALRAKGTFVMGKKEGQHREWDASSQLAFEGEYLNGVPNGIHLEWYPHDSSRKVLKSKIGYKDAKLHGPRIIYFTNGVKAEESAFYNGLPDGKYSSWYENGELHEKKCYKMGKAVGAHESYHPPFAKGEKSKLAKLQQFDEEGQPDGEQKTYYPNGTLQSIITYNHGLKNGRQAFYNPHELKTNESFFVLGKLEGTYFEMTQDRKEIHAHFTNNRLDGPYRVLYPASLDGEKLKALDATYVNGRLDGEAIEYNTQGLKITSIHYREGKREGPFIIYNNEGRIKIRAEFKEDKQEGITFEYFPDGKIHLQASFIHDKREGNEIVYNTSGNIISLSSYKNDLLDGPKKEWNDEGKPLFDAEYKEGKKHGSFLKYHPDGRVHTFMLYVNDELQEKKVFGDEAD